MREMSSWVIAVCIICRGCINLYSVNFVIPLSTDSLATGRPFNRYSFMSSLHKTTDQSGSASEAN